jgi:excisionase family DNA binding protein
VKPARDTEKRGGDLSPADVAEATGLSRSLIYREIERGNLAAYRVGTRLRIEAEAVATWKARCRVRPRSEPPIYELLSAQGRGARQSSEFVEQLAAVETQGRVA